MASSFNDWFHQSTPTTSLASTFYISVNETNHGPYTGEQMYEFFSAGDIHPDTWCSKDGCAWAPAKTLLHPKQYWVEKFLMYGGTCIQQAPDHIKNDQDCVLAALNQSGLALEYLSDEFRNNNEIVMVAVATTANAICFASEHLKNTKEVLLMAATQKGYTKDSSEETIKDIILWAVKEDWMRMLWVCLFFSPELVV